MGWVFVIGYFGGAATLLAGWLIYSIACREIDEAEAIESETETRKIAYAAGRESGYEAGVIDTMMRYDRMAQAQRHASRNDNQSARLRGEGW